MDEVYFSESLVSSSSVLLLSHIYCPRLLTLALVSGHAFQLRSYSLICVPLVLVLASWQVYGEQSSSHGSSMLSLLG